MFVDIRSFTAGSAQLSPTKAVGLLERVPGAVMVDAVEGEHCGNDQQIPGDGFMALFELIAPTTSRR